MSPEDLTTVLRRPLPGNLYQKCLLPSVKHFWHKNKIIVFCGRGDSSENFLCVSLWAFCENILLIYSCMLWISPLFFSFIKFIQLPLQVCSIFIRNISLYLAKSSKWFRIVGEDKARKESSCSLTCLLLPPTKLQQYKVADGKDIWALAVHFSVYITLCQQVFTHEFLCYRRTVGIDEMKTVCLVGNWLGSKKQSIWRVWNRRHTFLSIHRKRRHLYVRNRSRENGEKKSLPLMFWYQGSGYKFVSRGCEFVNWWIH